MEKAQRELASLIGDSAALTPPAISRVEALVQQWPQLTATKMNTYGQLPLHLAALRTDHHAADLIRVLIRANPATARAADSLRQRPLHLAVSVEQTSTAVVDALLEAAPRATTAVDFKRSRPLHVAAGKQRGDIGAAIVDCLLQVAPGVARSRDGDGMMPLHIAVSAYTPSKGLHMISRLIRAAPEVLRIKSHQEDDQLPIHWAAEHSGTAHVTLISLLLTSEELLLPPIHWQEQSLMTFNGAEELPLHIATEVNTNFKAQLTADRATEAQVQTGSNDADGRTHRDDLEVEEEVAVVKLLLARAPLAASETNGSGRTPLHNVLMYQRRSAATAMVEMLLAVAPHTASMADGDKQSPLHYACGCNDGYVAPAAVVQALLEAAPQTALIPDWAGCLPLHCFVTCEHKDSDVTVLRALLQAGPAALLTVNRDGSFPLHLSASSCIGAAGAVVFKSLLRAASFAATVPARFGWLPLHLLVSNQKWALDMEIFDALLGAAPHAVLHLDDDGWLPLHFAAMHQGGERGVALVQALLKAAPESVRMADKWGRLPLHIAAACQGARKGLAVVKLLMEAYPQAVLTADRLGCLPLHWAASCPGMTEAKMLQVGPECSHGYHHFLASKKFDDHSQLDDRLVDLLLQAAPHTVVAADIDGWLPLHYAAGSLDGQDNGRAITRTLLQAGPQAALVADGRGHLPIHLHSLRADREQSVGLLPLLLEATPKALTTADLTNGRLLLHMACSFAGRAAYLDILLKAAPETILLADNNGNLPLHLLASAPHPKGSLAAVRLLVGAAPAAVTTTNHLGCYPLHFASAWRCRRGVAKFLLRAAPQVAVMTNRAGETPFHMYGSQVLQRDWCSQGFLVMLLRAAPHVLFAPDNEGCWPKLLPLLDFPQARKLYRQVIEELLRIQEVRKNPFWKNGNKSFVTFNFRPAACFLELIHPCWQWPLESHKVLAKAFRLRIFYVLLGQAASDIAVKTSLRQQTMVKRLVVEEAPIPVHLPAQPVNTMRRVFLARTWGGSTRSPASDSLWSWRLRGGVEDGADAFEQGRAEEVWMGRAEDEDSGDDDVEEDDAAFELAEVRHQRRYDPLEAQRHIWMPKTFHFLSEEERKEDERDAKSQKDQKLVEAAGNHGAQYL